MNKETLKQESLRDQVNFAGGYAAGLMSSPVFWVVEAVAFATGMTGKMLTSVSESLKKPQSEEPVVKAEETEEETPAAAGATA